MPPVILLVAMAAGATGNGLAPSGNTGTPAMAPGGGMQPYGNVPGVVVPAGGPAAMVLAGTPVTGGVTPGGRLGSS